MIPLLPSLLLLLPQQENLEETRERLKTTVTYLASEDLKGRKIGTPEGEKAGRWMAAQFEKLGLKKAAADGYLQSFQTRGDEPRTGYNVIGLLEGTTEELVVLGCHHDHEGVVDGKIFPGANDNASGCAVLLEVARRAVAENRRPRRGILFCSFDGEEALLAGSRHFVSSKLHDLSKIASMVCMDMMGGDFFPADSTSLYVFGAENSPEIADVLVRQPRIDRLDRRILGINLIEPLGDLYARSDYGSFRARRIPFLFFTTGQPWTYHTPDDRIERINFDRMARAVGLVFGVTTGLADLEARPRYVRRAGLSMDDLKVVSETLERVIAHPADLNLTDADLALLKQAVEQIGEIQKSGTLSPADAEALQKTAFALMGLTARRPANQQ